MTHEIPAGQGSLLAGTPAQWPAADGGSTGDDGVDRLLAGELADLPERPIDEHNAVYIRLHDGLLGELDTD